MVLEDLFDFYESIDEFLIMEGLWSGDLALMGLIDRFTNDSPSFLDELDSCFLNGLFAAGSTRVEFSSVSLKVLISDFSIYGSLVNCTLFLPFSGDNTFVLSIFSWVLFIS